MADKSEENQNYNRRKDKLNQTRRRGDEQREADTTEEKQKQSRRKDKQKQTRIRGDEQSEVDAITKRSILKGKQKQRQRKNC